MIFKSTKSESKYHGTKKRKQIPSGVMLFGPILLLSCITPDPKYLKNRKEIHQARKDSLGQIFREAAKSYQGPCHKDSDCKALAMAGACCGCSVAVLTKHQSAKVHAKLDDLCIQWSEDLEGEDCMCDDALKSRCLDGVCTLTDE